MRKKKVLKLEQTGPIANCSNDACALLLASYGLVTAASFVVSGSIVVVSNTVYWLEKQSDCEPQSQKHDLIKTAHKHDSELSKIER